MKYHDISQKLETCGLQLSRDQIEEINRYLALVGDYGEIRLVIQHGELRYINTLASHKVCMAADGTEKDFGKMK